jgi:hypothetical protein
MRPGLRIGSAGVAALVLAGGALVSPVHVSAQEDADSCRACHSALTGLLGAPAGSFAEDVHAQAGFGCSACHGGDPTVAGLEAMDPDKGYIGIPTAPDVPGLCGRCHSNAGFMRQYNPSLRVDQEAEYVTSVHGQQLLGAGDEAVATCSSCHMAHSIRPANDPRSSVNPLRVADTCGRCHSDSEHMEPYGIPTDQQAKYEGSVHWYTMSEGGDTSAPTCNDCHGNHGAAPPGVSWVGNVCGQCHVVMAEHFQESHHSETFAAMGVPGCAFCHQNHEIAPASDEMLGIGEGAVCRSCHSEGDTGGTAAAGMRGMIDTLRGEIDSATTVLHAAENAGMEVSASLAALSDAQSALVKARAALHSFDPEVVAAEVEPGSEISGEALAKGEEALRDLQIRRIGLAISVLIIAGLITGLILKIREMERPA